jgi:hypothetical protein
MSFWRTNQNNKYSKHADTVVQWKKHPEITKQNIKW